MIDSSMMLPSSICSTLAILIAFSQYPSTASCVVTATGLDFTTILRRMFADCAASNAVHSEVPVSRVSSTCIPDSSSGIDFFSLCYPLPLTVNDADSTSSLLFGFACGSIGVSLGSGAADSVLGTATVALSLLFFLCSPLRTSSASASLITSFLRSNLSAPRGVVLRHASIRILQRSECACALLLSLIALQPGHPIVAPTSSMSCLVVLSLWIRAPSNGNGGIGIGST